VGEWQGYGYNITQALSSNIDDKTLHELYLWPFADAVRAGTKNAFKHSALNQYANDVPGVGSVMCAYTQGYDSSRSAYAAQSRRKPANLER
jgi:beta-glucosidase-like glycosyl hydrolase